MKKTFLPLVLTLLCVCFLSGSGPGSDTPETQKKRGEKSSTNEFHAWLIHPEHIYEANLIKLNIRLFPNISDFPGMKKADVKRVDDMVIVSTVQLEKVSVPLWNTQIAGRPQAHIERERARGREALEFCRRSLLNASGLLVVSPQHKNDDRMIHCKIVMLDELGNRTDLGKLLENNGLASTSNVNWGLRLPK